MNKTVAKKDFENYLQEARTWETDKLKENQKSKKIAWCIAIVSCFTTFASVLAIAVLVPLKSVEPYVIRVDSSTGITDVIKPMKDSKTNYDEAINKYFTQWYVRYREGYSKALSEDYYTNVGLMSGSLEQQKYHAFFQPENNPQSPLNVYGAYANVKVKIKGTSFIKPNIAIVRYTKEVEHGLDKPQATHWTATITFTYSGAPMSEQDRAINPLGFQVIEYRNDPDALQHDATEPAKINYTPTATQTDTTAFPGQTANTHVPHIQVAR